MSDLQQVLTLLNNIQKDISEIKADVVELKRRNIPYVNQSQIMSAIYSIDNKVSHLSR